MERIDTDTLHFLALPLGELSAKLTERALGVVQTCWTVLFAQVFQICVGADAHIGPAESTVFMVICGEFAISSRADVGIGPYTFPENSAKNQSADLVCALERKKRL